MKPLLILLLLFPALVPAQTEYTYSYDDAGNRIERFFVLYKKAEPQTQVISNYTIKVFPNPASKYL